MDSKYLRLPQDASDLLYSGNEKEGNGRRPRFSWGKLILSLSVVVNIFLSVSVVLMLREKPTPTGFGENERSIRVRVVTDRSQPRSTLSRPHGTNSGGTQLTVPRTTPIATSCGKLSSRLMVSWQWTENGRSRDNGRHRCTYRAITVRVSICWKPIINCTVWSVLIHPVVPS